MTGHTSYIIWLTLKELRTHVKVTWHSAKFIYRKMSITKDLWDSVVYPLGVPHGWPSTGAPSNEDEVTFEAK